MKNKDDRLAQATDPSTPDGHPRSGQAPSTSDGHPRSGQAPSTPDERLRSGQAPSTSDGHPRSGQAPSTPGERLRSGQAPSTPGGHPRSERDLRRQAEAKWSERQQETGPLPATESDTRRLVHDLRVHQIELEMQNEELRRTQVELDAARARYFDLYDLAPVGYCTVSEQGLILEANLTATILLGVDRGALVKQPLSRFILKEDQGIYYLHRKQLFETGEPQACELRMVKKDGTARVTWTHLEATAAQDADGAPVFRVVLSDITALKQAEEALRELNTTLEERVHQRTRELAEANAHLSDLDQLKDDFISRISHELLTPLTGIILYLDLLENGKPEKRAQHLQVLEQTARLQQLIESLLEVTQLSVNTAGLHIAPTDLNHLATSLVADMAPRAARRNLTLTHTLTPDLPLVSAEAILLKRALSHLVTNALNYTPAGGTIDLATARVIDNGETWITFTVRDSGPGIAPDEQSYIFDRFYRGRAAADYKTPGAGVGLAISRDILTSMDGRVTVDSRPATEGSGAVFTAWLKPA